MRFSNLQANEPGFVTLEDSPGEEKDADDSAAQQHDQENNETDDRQLELCVSTFVGRSQ